MLPLDNGPSGSETSCVTHFNAINFNLALFGVEYLPLAGKSGTTMTIRHVGVRIYQKSWIVNF